MKTIVVGDLHLKQSRILPQVERAVARHGAGRVVLCGDYVDEFGATDEDELRELTYMAGWLEARRAEGLMVDALLGNHDFAYLMGWEISGYRPTVAPSVRWMLKEMHLAVATTVGDILVTHAGLTSSWAQKHPEVLGSRAVAQADLAGENPEGARAGEEAAAGVDGGTCSQEPCAAEVACVALGTLYAQGPESEGWNALFAAGPARGGWQRPGPLWADVHELMAGPAPGMRQIVGHTPLDTCTRLDAPSEIWACDTFSCYRSGNPIGDGTGLLVDDDGTITIVSVRDEGDDSAADDEVSSDEKACNGEA